MSKLKQALKDKIQEFETLIDHPDHNSEMEQNAIIVCLRELHELDQIVEYDDIEVPILTPTSEIIKKGLLS